MNVKIDFFLLDLAEHLPVEIHVRPLTALCLLWPKISHQWVGVMANT